MPLGSWADVTRRLDRNPEWKLCLDIEPISWNVLRRTDPRSYQAVRQYLGAEDGSSRVEMVAASYAQPFGWVIGGESNIRHLIRGREIVNEHFPGIEVDTYATQEPCWTSSLPQILRSLGFKRAVLKNPGTAWGGYASGIDRETVLWVGPDGTSIPCVPRYHCEELRSCWETEAGQMEPDFVEKCIEGGILHPVGSFLQDLGWPARPHLDRDGDEIQYVTWREYMEDIAAEPTEEWHFTQEDIRCTLPWGEGTLQRMSREVRAAEHKIIAAEKIASIAGIVRGGTYPEEKLREAWDQLLLSQHHDAWICATTRTGREQWAWQAGAQSWMAELLCDDIVDAALDRFRSERDTAIGSEIRVFNTLGSERKELMEVQVPAEGETASFRVSDADGNEIPSQTVPTRTSQVDGGIYAGKLLFEAESPAMGYRTYRIEHVKRKDGRKQDIRPDEPGACATVCDTQAVITTDLYEICIDKQQGGAITRWFDKSAQRSIVANDRPFNEFSGYFMRQDRWASSAEFPVALEIKENGPLRVVLEMKGKVEDVDFMTTLTAAQGQRRVDFRVRFHFHGETRIGDPWQIEPERRNTERRKSHHNTRYKLQARFPTLLNNLQIYKNSAFDVTLSRHEDTHYERWDEIKHNIILNWLDAYEERQDYGVAVFSDHTTDYSHSPGDGLALTLGWGGEGGFWWGDRPLTGVQEMSYAVLPHGGRWDRAGIQQECARWVEPLLPLYGCLSGASACSLLRVTDPSIEITSVRLEGCDLLVRLYNSGSEAKMFSLVLAADLFSGDLSKVELDGRLIEPLPYTLLPDRSREAGLSLPRHGLATVRVSKAAEAMMKP